MFEWPCTFDLLPIMNDAKDLQQRTKERCIWTDELHEKFLAAMDSIGIELMARPMEILEHMKVPGLTKRHVKSHLQKYRLKVAAAREGSVAALAALQMLAGEDVTWASVAPPPALASARRPPRRPPRHPLRHQRRRPRQSAPLPLPPSLPP